jgi:hypothetical protein
VEDEDSDLYRDLFEEGRELEARRLILLVGQERFGPPPEEVRARLEAITDIERLEQMLDVVLYAARWSDLLGGN